jgi:hypothetical protein
MDAERFTVTALKFAAGDGQTREQRLAGWAADRIAALEAVLVAKGLAGHSFRVWRGDGYVDLKVDVAGQ